MRACDKVSQGPIAAWRTIEEEMLRLTLLSVATLVLLLALVRPHPGPAPSDRAATLAASLMSPFCHGMTLATCPSSAAGELRQELQARIAAGESESSITDSLAVRFGTDLRGSPKPEGVALWLWVGPGLAGLLMIIILARAGRHKKPDSESIDITSIDAELAARLDDELHQLG